VTPGPRKESAGLLVFVPFGVTNVDIDDNTPTEQFIGWTLERFRNRRMVLTTSFGMEGCALIDTWSWYRF
jgi:hypothetical protein